MEMPPTRRLIEPCRLWRSSETRFALHQARNLYRLYRLYRNSGTTVVQVPLLRDIVRRHCGKSDTLALQSS